MKLPNSGQLFATVSAAALIVATRSVSLAADIPEGVATPHVEEAADIWVSVEGRWNIIETGFFGSRTPHPDPDPDDDPWIPRGAWETDPANGWGGGIEVGGRPAGSDLDFVLRVVFNQSAGGDQGGLIYGEASYVNDSEVTERHIVADFEIGRQMNIGMGGQTRVHGGLRFAHFDADQESRYYYLYDFGYNQKTSVIGPRIGIDHDVHLGNNFTLGLNAAGAVLFGGKKRVAHCNGDFCWPDLTDNGTATVWNAEGSASLNYLFGSGAFEVGWRVDAFWDVFDPGIDPTGDEDFVTHGPYAKYTYYLSGESRAFSPAATYDWTGFYLGGYLGGAWVAENTQIDLDGYTSFPFDVGDTFLLEGKHLFIGGGNVGYNFQTGNFVFGVETDLTYLGYSVRDNVTYRQGGDLEPRLEANADWLGTLRARFGYAIDRTLFYASGGLAYSDLEYRVYDNAVDETPETINASIKPNWGWAIGVGADHAFTDNWSAKAEYMYAKFDGETPCGVSSGGDDPGGTFCWNFGDTKMHVVRFGASYNF